MRWARFLLALAAAFAVVLNARSHAQARATLTVMSADGAGEGFNDPTPATPVGGNSGTTLGQQRLNSVQHAADLWGAVLDSSVTIVISATFDPLGCSSGAAILAQATSAGVHTGITGNGADPSLLYPRPLAERLEGRDLAPGEPDIQAYFNTSIDDAGCLMGAGWYYGLDGNPGNANDLVNTALHEFGHGLGVADYADLDTGALLQGVVDAFSTHVFDEQLGKHWSEMSDSERVTSTTDVRAVSWDGALTTAAAQSFLAPGTPRLVTMPAVAGLSGFVADTSFGVIPTQTPASAPLVIANPVDGCMMPTNAIASRIVMFMPNCQPSAIASIMKQANAIGALMAVSSDRDTPPIPLEEGTAASVAFPVISLSPNDMQLLSTAVGQGSVNAQLSADASRLLGTDDHGRVLLNVTKPVSSSSISHWDVLARPNLLMEPIATPGQPNDVDLTAPMLRDLGWQPLCGNGQIDANETCDDGTNNSDTRANACRSDCQRASCGDGVVDSGEACDDGAGNSDTNANACRTNCERASCGDGVVDSGETCDRGTNNSDIVADACRTSCKKASCGDGIIDTGEACDDGRNDSDTAADACRTSCKKPSCGDGVIDTGEACDNGTNNSDTTADACRTSCKKPSCGDGVVDTGESCDDGSGRCDHCSGTSGGTGGATSATSKGTGGTTATMSTRGDAGVGSDAGSSESTSTSTNTSERDAGELGNGHRVSASCSCDLSHRRDDSARGWLAGALLMIALARSRKRNALL